ncbi:hypothetical protein [Chryseobacterium fistulae]|nr:hypothetical protein [Chryseobacterium fistulae]
MKKLIIGFIALAITSSCNSSNDDISTPTNPTKVETVSVLPVTVKYVSNKSEFFATYSYSGDKINEIVGSDGRKLVYTYNGDNIIKEEFSVNGKSRFIKDFSYSNDKIMSIKYTNKTASPEIIYTKNIQYLDANHIKYDDFSVDGTPSLQYDLYYDNNWNETKREIRKIGSTGNPATTQVSTFDNKNNPIKNIKGYVKITRVDSTVGLGLLGYHNKGGNNNLLTTTDSVGILIEDKIDYNINSYPLSIMSTNIFDNIGAKIEYSYNK